MKGAVLAILVEIQSLVLSVKQGKITTKEYKSALFKLVEENINQRLASEEAEELLVTLESKLPPKSYDRLVDYILEKRSAAHMDSEQSDSASATDASNADAPSPVMNASAESVQPDQASENESRSFFAPLQFNGDLFARRFVAYVYPFWCLVTYFFNDSVLGKVSRLDVPGLKMEMQYAAATGIVSLILGFCVNRNVRAAFPLTRIFLLIIALSPFYLSFLQEFLAVTTYYTRYPKEFLGYGMVLYKSLLYLIEQPMHLVRLVYAVPAALALFTLGKPSQDNFR